MNGLLAVGYWLLAIGCWLLAIGCWLLAIGYSSVSSNQYVQQSSMYAEYPLFDQFMVLSG
jgi:hypothetical protein